MDKQDRKATIDSRYIQQHLANERTYLAWIRTAIAMAGIGFVFLNLHFTMQIKVFRIEDQVVAAVGFIAFLLGMATIIFATADYFNKRKRINDQTFQSPIRMVFVVSISLVIVMSILMVSYFLMRNIL
ncbi:YidH family protein [Fictibacillus sp. KU28468]|uniref:YidH family protein n=1 Tax=Fictibacillus sp. KU28468 TaxID=2991053 RepID=UPI0006A76044|nr:DUF202 domain-containing protein [Fictibacillus sp. KU28468]UZJ78275.1 DUF202 domain-containing protein [Fictibacillus sp. KU28468]